MAAAARRTRGGAGAPGEPSRAACPCGAAADATAAVRGAARSGAGLDVTLRSGRSFRCPEPKGPEWLGLGVVMVVVLTVLGRAPYGCSAVE